jgi:hypothetical protein
MSGIGKESASQKFSDLIIAWREAPRYTRPWKWEAGMWFDCGGQPDLVVSVTHKGGSTMRKVCVALGLVVAMCVAVAVRAEEGKEVDLKGTITCAKCDLKKEKECATVIVVKENGKDVVYYFDKESGKKNHKAICTEAKKGSVKGTCKKEGDKLVVTVKEVKFED